MSVPTAERFHGEDDSPEPDFVSRDGRFEFEPYSKPRTKVIGDLALYGIDQQPENVTLEPWWREMTLDDGKPDPLGLWATDKRESWEKNGAFSQSFDDSITEENPGL